MTTSTKGYYSIVQYCPDPSRLEAVNIGVVLFCPEVPFLKARFGKRKKPISALFGRQEWEFLEAQKASLEARFERRTEEFRDLEAFELFVAKRASALRLTLPRSVKVEEPQKELNALLSRLVGVQREAALAQRSSHRALLQELKSCFHSAGIWERLEPGVTVCPPTLPKPFKAPFAFRNGKLNLVEPVQFEGQSAEAVFGRASVHAVEGQFLSEYADPEWGQLGLVVVGKFTPDQESARKTVGAVLSKHQVKFHTFDNLEPLIAEIRDHAHE